jgi:transposase-like protein
LTKKRKQYKAEFKFQMALEAIKGLKTINQLASEHELHPNQLSQWKRQLLEEGPAIFSKSSSQPRRETAKVEADLYEQIGRLKMELEWLKKKCPAQLRPNGC